MLQIAQLTDMKMKKAIAIGVISLVKVVMALLTSNAMSVIMTDMSSEENVMMFVQQLHIFQTM